MEDLHGRLAWMAAHRRDVRAMLVIEVCAQRLATRVSDEGGEPAVALAVADRLTTPLPTEAGLRAWHRGLIEAFEAHVGRSLADAALDAQDVALLERALRDVPVLSAAAASPGRSRSLQRVWALVR